jgi:hypothetical protein
MTPEIVFSVANTLAVVVWIALAIQPRRRVIADTLAGLVIPSLFAAAYLVIVIAAWPGTPGGFSTLADVGLLFQNRWLLLAGWLHYLAFDLLTGAWETRDATMQGVPPWALVPCLVLTFMFGPAGWLLYRIVRTRWMSGVSESSARPA